MNKYKQKVSGYCILELETGFLDGNYTPITYNLFNDATTMKEHWDKERSEFTHYIIYTENHIKIPDNKFLPRVILDEAIGNFFNDSFNRVNKQIGELK